MKKKLLVTLCLLLCMVLLLPVAGCEKKAATPAPIEFPVKGLTWGMTVEEAKEVLAQKGVTPMMNDTNTGSITLGIAPEDLGKLGMEKIAGLELQTQNYKVMDLQFDEMDNGVYRLVYGNALVWATTEKTELTEDEVKELLCTALDNAYGKPPETKRTHWCTYGAVLTEEDCAKLSPETLARVQRENYAVDSIYPSVWFMPDGGGSARVLLNFSGMDYVELLYGQ